MALLLHLLALTSTGKDIEGEGGWGTVRAGVLSCTVF